jgi:hypothetical protein
MDGTKNFRDSSLAIAFYRHIEARLASVRGLGGFFAFAASRSIFRSK